MTGAEVKRGIAGELRDWNEVHREQGEVARYLAVELPIVIQALREGEPSFKRESHEHVSKLNARFFIVRISNIMDNTASEVNLATNN